MANFNTYPSIGIDSKIKMLQNILSNELEFNNVNFYGRAHRTISKDLKKIIPCVYSANNELKEVYYDDITASGGNIFFLDNENHECNEPYLFTADVKVVFMLNLKKLVGPKNYIADSEVQDICVKLIQKSKILEIRAIQKGLKNVLSGFDIDSVKLKDTHPFHLFSINGYIKYQFNCKTT